MKPKKQEDKSSPIVIGRINLRSMEMRVLGRSPLLMNRMAEKVRQELLLPARRKTAADKASKLKHDPMEEYRSSMYKSSHPTAKTALHLPSGSFSKSMAQAALDMPGSSKAQIQRLVRVNEFSVAVYGIPFLHMGVVRTMGINKTPDIRTRAMLKEWAATFTVQFVSDLIGENAIASLIDGAGFLSGVGDWRGEKGGDFGKYGLCLTDEDELEFERITKEGNRAAQVKAMANPEPYDEETAELLTWFEHEVEAHHQNKLPAQNKLADKLAGHNNKLSPARK